jgi:hypothetical protein
LEPSDSTGSTHLFAAKFAVRDEASPFPTSSNKIGDDDTQTYRKDTEDADT